jgi:hypothetical protein
MNLICWFIICSFGWEEKKSCPESGWKYSAIYRKTGNFPLIPLQIEYRRELCLEALHQQLVKTTQA